MSFVTLSAGILSERWAAHWLRMLPGYQSLTLLLKYWVTWGSYFTSLCLFPICEMGLITHLQELG